MNWKETEILKYRGKNVDHNGEKHIVEEVFWNDCDEVFIYYIKNEQGTLRKVFEKDIELV